MSYLYLVLFVIMTGIHLYASLKCNKYLRGVTKATILLLVLGFYLESIETPMWVLVLALLTSWLGDLLLIPHGVKWFTIGGISFWASHALFIATYCKYITFSNVPIFAIVGIGLVYAIASTLIFRKLKQYLPKPLFIPMYLYLLTNGAMNCYAWFRLISGVSVGSLITAIGALLFFISDSSLFFVRFNKDGKLKTHFLVMLTYAVGEFLIVLGLVL